MIKELKNYNYDPSSLDWIPQGGWFMEYLGMSVIKIDFTRTKEANPETREEAEWESKMGSAILLSTHDYDPMTETCVLKFQEVDYSKPEEEWEVKELRIVPPGFSYGNPEETGTMTRFIPHSLHTKKMETEAYYEKLRHIFNSPAVPMLSLDTLTTLATSGDKQRLLKNVHNIVLVAKEEGEESVYCYRLGDIYVRHQFKSVYKITTKAIDGKGELTLFLDLETPDHLVLRNGLAGKEIAKVKIYDLKDIFAVKFKEEDKKETPENLTTE